MKRENHKLENLTYNSSPKQGTERLTGANEGHTDLSEQNEANALSALLVRGIQFVLKFLALLDMLGKDTGQQDNHSLMALFKSLVANAPDISDIDKLIASLAGTAQVRPGTPPARTLESNDPPEPPQGSPTLSDPPPASATSRTPVVLRRKKGRTLWVREQIDQKKTNKEIFNEWNKMSHNARAAVLNISIDDYDQRKQYEPFKYVSNIERIRDDYESEKRNG